MPVYRFSMVMCAYRFVVSRYSVLQQNGGSIRRVYGRSFHSGAISAG